MEWKSTISRNPDLNTAMRECLDQLPGWRGRTHLACVFLHGSHRHGAEWLAARLRDELAPGHLIGCTGGGIIGAGLEVELAPALSVTVAELPEVHVHGFAVDEGPLPSPDAPPQAWLDLLHLPPGHPEVKAILLLGESFEFDLDALLAGLDYAFPQTLKVGGLASDARPGGGNRLLWNERFQDRGVVGIALSGALQVDAVVAQGCRPLGKPLTVTRGERNLILELDGQRPLQQLENVIRQAEPRERRLAETSLLIGVGSEARWSLDSILQGSAPEEPDYLIRNLVGVDPRRGALVIGSRVRVGQTVQFHVRDAETSRQDLARQLAKCPVEGAAGALLFQCLGRGEYLYKTPNHDAGEFTRRFPDAALGGFFCNGEIGPVGNATYLHGYTSCFAVFRPT